MEQWEYKKSVLRFINILFLSVFIIMITMNKVILGKDYFNMPFISIFLSLVLMAVFLLSFIKMFDKYYQMTLYIIFWIITALATNIAFLDENNRFYSLHILLLLISVSAIFNKKTIKGFFGFYLIVVLPIIITSDSVFSKKAVSLILIAVILFITYIKSQYDIKVFNAYQAAKYEQNLILENALEAFALHEIILNDLGEPVNYRYININEAFEKMTGLSKAEVIGNTVLDILPRTEKYWIDTFGEVVLKGVKKTITNYSNELGKYYEVNAYPIGGLRFAVLFTDVTERIQRERELKYALERAEKVDQLKNQFLRDVNHRLRTPLNGMMGMLQLVNVDEVGEENKELLAAALMEMRHSRNIINQISKYVDIQGMQFEFTQQNIVELIVAEIKKHSNAENQIKFIRKKTTDKFLYIEMNVFKTVFNEVVSNAIEHTKNNQIEVILDCDWSIEKRIHFLRIEVMDYGNGISDENLKYIFNEFYHHDFINIYKDEDKVSVPICKQMLLSCGGDLLVTSKLDHGSTFTIILPAYSA